MVFLRPVVMRDAETTNRISLDRYEQIRGFQKAMQPNSSVLVPINESPIIPPMRQVDEAGYPLSAPQTSPGTTPNPLQRQQAPPPNTAASAVEPTAAPASVPASAPTR